jgi:hypothetical protein
MKKLILGLVILFCVLTFSPDTPMFSYGPEPSGVYWTYLDKDGNQQIQKIKFVYKGDEIIGCSKAEAADYSISTNAIQEKGLTFIVARENEARAKQNPPLPALSNQEYINLIMQNVFNSYVKQAIQDETNKLDLQNRWQSLTQTQKDQIKTILGIQ